MDYEVVGHTYEVFFFSKLTFNLVASESHLLETKGSLKNFVLLLSLWKACQWY